MAALILFSSLGKLLVISLVRGPVPPTDALKNLWQKYISLWKSCYLQCFYKTPGTIILTGWTAARCHLHAPSHQMYGCHCRDINWNMQWPHPCLGISTSWSAGSVLLMEEGLELDDFKVPSNPNHSTVLFPLPENRNRQWLRAGEETVPAHTLPRDWPWFRC